MSETMKQILNQVYESAGIYGMKILGAIVIMVAGVWIARLIRRAVRKGMRKANVEETLISFTTHVVYMLSLVFVFVAAISKLGVQTASIIAALGAATLAIGFALQGSLSNFAAAVMLIIFKPFKVGDYIDVSGNGGTVQKIEMFQTILKAPDNTMIIVPNSKITSDRIINYTAIETRRLEWIFGIAYGDDIKKSKEILINLVQSDSRVLKEPAPMAAVKNLGDSSVDLVLRAWSVPSDYWDVNFDILEKGKLALEAGGMNIPFPQRDIHVFEEKKISQ